MIQSRIITTISAEPKVLDSTGGKIISDTVSMTIPKNAVASNTSFSIKPVVSRQITPPAKIQRISNLCEVEPHDVTFNESVTLTFKVPTTNPCVLYVQKNNIQHQELDKWLVVKPESLSSEGATFSLKSFSFMFLGKPIETKVNTAPVADANKNDLAKKLETEDYAEPGLNFRAICNCKTTAEGLVVIPLGYGVFSVNEEIDKGNVKCKHCKKVLDDSELVKQIILFEATGKLTYRLNVKPKPPLKEDLFNTGDGLCVYGRIGEKAEDYSMFCITVEKPPFNSSNIAMLSYDKDGNPIGSIYDLGSDGGFSKFKIIIGKFYSEPGFSVNDLEQNAVKALKEKGFQVFITENEDEFLQKLLDYDQAWIISFCMETPIKNKTFANKVQEFHLAGKGLMLWEDNDSKPNTRTNQVLQLLFNMQVQGNSLGTKKMMPSADGLTAQTFNKSHPVMHGIMSLYEGTTICHPTTVPNTVKVLATSSFHHPNIMCVDKTNTSGAVLIDCGFTKLFSTLWDTAGTSRYVKNAACWLTGISTAMQ